MSRRAFFAVPGFLADATRGPQLAYVGTYSSPQGPEGSNGHGEGIYLFEVNPATGALTKREVFRNASNPSWLALNATGTRLYSANETQSGSVSAYRVERATGKLTLLNTQSSHGASPCHLSIHPSGRYVMVANYDSGTLAVLPVGRQGELGPATDVKTDKGMVGPTRARSGPPGSFAISGHDRPHAHMIHSDPGGRFVLSTDLGQDRIWIWRLDLETGKLIPNEAGAVVNLPDGDGPRHFAFHPNGRRLYSLQEEASTLAVFDYDGEHGRLRARQTVSTLPEGFAGTDFTSEVTVSADGRFVYAANRLHDSISWFAVRPDGTLTWAGEEWTRGDYPRSFAIDPSGHFLYSCNERADAITTFSVNRETGALSFTGQCTPVGTPAIVIFLV